uniref:Minor capsid protein P8 central region domain-containing protein n=1 Tax=viral metagenome TaxID=1070528 RepID=A0A6C0I572_9ZZZZ
MDIHKTTQILDMERYNGRINIVEKPPENVIFEMQERISVKNKTTEYREALVGTLECNVLAQVYFSKENIQIVQNGLRAGVYKMSDSKFVIAPQNVDTLKIIMRSIYLQHAEHFPTDITGQVERLNSLVLEYAIPTVYNETMGYIKYCQDQSTLVVPLALPRSHDRDYKQLELKPWF